MTTDGTPLPHRGGGLKLSLAAAVAGVLATVASQRNMKIHVVAALLVTIVGMALPLDLATRIALLFAVALVFFAEILNTALEAFVDLHVQQFHRLAMTAKDAAAAGVLVLSLFSVVAFLEVLYTEWRVVVANVDAVLRSVVFGVPLALLEALGLFVLTQRRWQVLRVLLSFLCLVPLVINSRDPLFSLVAVVLVVTAFFARTRSA